MIQEGSVKECKEEKSFPALLENEWQTHERVTASPPPINGSTYDTSVRRVRPCMRGKRLDPSSSRFSTCPSGRNNQTRPAGAGCTWSGCSIARAECHDRKLSVQLVRLSINAGGWEFIQVDVPPPIMEHLSELPELRVRSMLTLLEVSCDGEPSETWKSS